MGHLVLNKDDLIDFCGAGEMTPCAVSANQQVCAAAAEVFGVFPLARPFLAISCLLAITVWVHDYYLQ